MQICESRVNELAKMLMIFLLEVQTRVFFCIPCNVIRAFMMMQVVTVVIAVVIVVFHYVRLWWYCK